MVCDEAARSARANLFSEQFRAHQAIAGDRAARREHIARRVGREQSGPHWLELMPQGASGPKVGIGWRTYFAVWDLDFGVFLSGFGS
jgi:hypothetical protein